MNKNTKIIVGASAVLLIGAGAFFFLKKKKNKDSSGSVADLIASQGNTKGSSSSSSGGSSSSSSSGSSGGSKGLSGLVGKAVAGAVSGGSNSLGMSGTQIAERSKRLHTAMKGWGTYEYMIWSALDNTTSAQRTAIKNHFDSTYGDGEDLIEWFRDDLEGEDLKKALSYYGKNNK